MIKLTFCLVRQPHLTREAFQAYWFDVHGPLVASVADILGIRRYIQLHSLPAEASAGLRATREAPEEYDGVAELWIEPPAGAPTAEAQAAAELLLADERKFIDLSRSPLWWGEERVVVGGRQIPAERDQQA